MAGLGRENTLYSIAYPRLPEISSNQGGASPVASASHTYLISNEEKRAAARLNFPSQTHLVAPPAYQSESCQSPTDILPLEPLRTKEPPLTPYTSEHSEDHIESQRLSFWRKKRGIILTVVLSNLVILGVIFGGVLVSKHVTSHSRGSAEAATTTESYASSTATSLMSTMLPATTMSANPIKWAPNDDGTQAIGNLTDSGGVQNDPAATGAITGDSAGDSGPRNSPGSGKK